MMRHLRLIGVIAGRGLLEMSRMPGIVAVIFVPGIVMYIVFTVIFVGKSDDGGGPSMKPKITAAIIDQDHSIASRNLLRAMKRMSIDLITAGPDGKPPTAEQSRRWVESGHASVALIIPEGYGLHSAPNDPQATGVDLIVDETQPMEGPMVTGMLQMAAGMALMQTFTDAVQALFGGSGDTDESSDSATDTAAHAGSLDKPFGQSQMLLKVQTRGVAVVRTGRRPPPASLLYLAGLVPMFLLFNSSGAAGAVLEELASGATRRILVAPISSADYLLGHMIMSMVMSLLQTLSIYLCAWLVFGAPIFSYPVGLSLLTLATTCATVGFGMLMASIARRPEHLHSFGTVVILAMSAIGGSMFPRFFMPDWIKPLGLVTINGWAYDGFIELFRGHAIVSLIDELAVLTCAGLVLAGIGAWLLSRRLRTSGPQS